MTKMLNSNFLELCDETECQMNKHTGTFISKSELTSLLFSLDNSVFINEEKF